MTAPTTGYATSLIHQTPSALVTIDGVPTPVEHWRTSHGVDQVIGSLSVTLPTDSDLGHVDNNAVIEVQSGYANAPTVPTFSGRIVDLDRDFDARGRNIRIQCDDNVSLMAFPSETDTVFAGATPLYEIARSMATVRSMPLWEFDLITYPDGVTPVVFGGIAEIDGGDVIVKRNTAYHTWLAQKAKLFGYRFFGAPNGAARIQRVSGQPSGTPVASFAEGLNCFRLGTRRSTKPMVTNWTISGARFTDGDGVTIDLRSIPGVVPFEPYLAPVGYRSGSDGDPILTTQGLVDAVRNVMEIDRSEIYQLVTWETWGHPEIQPGDVIEVTSSSVGIPATTPYWVMNVTHQWDRSGFTTTLEGWAGSGEPLAAGIDETIIPISSSTYRLGDEYLWHYVYPNPPSGEAREKQVVPFTVPDVYTSLALRGRQHGTNSYQLDGANTDSTVSKLEVWQNGERVGTAQLPMSPENLSQRLDYDDDANWSPFRMPIPGKLEPGAAELHIIAGKDNRISTVYRIDDFEIKGPEVEARGTGTPVLPGGGL